MDDGILVPYEDLVRLHRYAEFSPRSEDDVMDRIQGLVRKAEEAEENLSGHEKLSAALLVLTTTQAASTDFKKPWRVAQEAGEDAYSNVTTGGKGVILWGDYDDGRDTKLAVLLHRTIEVQKDILKAALSQYVGGGDKVSSHDEPGATVHALALAEAILGKTS